MKIQKLDEGYLQTGTPYMIRNDGKVFDCGDNPYAYHPYIIRYDGVEKNTFEELMKDILTNIIYLSSTPLYWLYKHTKNEGTREHARNFVKAFLSSDYSINLIKKEKREGYKEELCKLYDISELFESSIPVADLVAELKQVDAELNQEFLRARTSDMYLMGTNKDIYFRISSVDFNWFDIIFNVISDNRNFINTITVTTDHEAARTDKNVIIKCNGVPLDHITYDEFMNIPGSHPVIEKYKCNKALYAGKSLWEALGPSRPERIVRTKKDLHYYQPTDFFEW